MVKYAPCAGMQPVNIVCTPRHIRRMPCSSAICAKAGRTPQCPATASVFLPTPGGACRTCMMVFIVSIGNMKECSVTPAIEPATTC